MDHVVIRAERPGDEEQVRRVNQRAFGRPDEAGLVDALRGSAGALSLVAVAGDEIVGHILFTPVRIDGKGDVVAAAGLAPMAVVPEFQRQGVGSRLVRAGLDACRSAGYDAVVVVGHPRYYPRFGFVLASSKGLEYEEPIPPEAFMAVELRPGALTPGGGTVRYRPEFSTDGSTR
jgi:putative acetyltransferase